MLATINTGSPAIPVWLWLLSTPGVGVLGALVVSHPIDRVRSIRSRRERSMAADDILLGRKANPDLGQEEIRPLYRIVAEHGEDLTHLRQTIGHMNGSGKTVMEHVESIDGRLKIVEAKVK